MFDWYVGIDWASEVHQVCLVDDRGVVRGERAVRHSGEELAALAAWLIEGAAPERIAVGIELPHGPVVESLMERGFAVHALNPKQLDRFRFRSPGPRTRCPGAGRQPTHRYPVFPAPEAG
jgi:transposase